MELSKHYFFCKVIKLFHSNYISFFASLLFLSWETQKKCLKVQMKRKLPRKDVQVAFAHTQKNANANVWTHVFFASAKSAETNEQSWTRMRKHSMIWLMQETKLSSSIWKIYCPWYSHRAEKTVSYKKRTRLWHFLFLLTNHT